jgi:hypothetical protein
MDRKGAGRRQGKETRESRDARIRAAATIIIFVQYLVGCVEQIQIGIKSRRIHSDGNLLTCSATEGVDVYAASGPYENTIGSC